MSAKAVLLVNTRADYNVCPLFFEREVNKKWQNLQELHYKQLQPEKMLL